MIRWLAAFGISATAALSAFAQTGVTVQPKGNVHLDDVIEVTVKIDHDYCPDFTPPVSGFTIESKRIDANAFRFYLMPQAVGRATFGPIDVSPAWDKSFHFDAIAFEIGPPLDDAEAPPEDVLKRQMRSGRYPFVVRVRGAERQRMAGEAFVLEMVAYTIQKDFSVQQVSAPDLGVRMMEVGRRHVIEETAAAGTPLRVESIARWAVATEGVTWSRSEPGWVTANVFPPERDHPVPIRRRVPAITLETIMPPFAVKHPIGAFRMTCPTMMWQGNGTAAGEIEVRGTGAFTNAKLEIEGSAPQPLFVHSIVWGTEASANDTDAYLQATIPIRVNSVANGERHVSLPAMLFRYQSPATGEVMTARCEGGSVTLHGTPEPRVTPSAIEAGAIPRSEAGASGGNGPLLVVQGIALGIAVLFATLAYRAATK